MQCAAVLEKSSEPTVSREEKISVVAYLKWQADANGQIVDDEKTRQFWLDAEKLVDAEG